MTLKRRHRNDSWGAYRGIHAACNRRRLIQVVARPRPHELGELLAAQVGARRQVGHVAEGPAGRALGH